MKHPEDDELFQLIKTLTKTEKTYFKKYASQHVKNGKNMYLHLFELMDKQESYSEHKIVSALKKDFAAEHISRSKNYLYNTILKALSSYHAEHSLKAEITELFRHVEILWERGLYYQCRKLLAKAKKMATQHDLQHLLLEALWWEQKLQYEIISGASVIHRIEETSVEQAHALRKYREQLLYDQVGRKLALVLGNKGKSRNREELQQYKEFSEHPLLLRDVNRVPHGLNRIQYYMIKDLAEVATDSYSDNNYSDLLYAYYKENPNLIPADLRRYSVFLSNRALFLLGKKDHEGIIKVLEEMNNIPVLYYKYCSPEATNSIRIDCCNAYLMYYLRTGNEAKALNIIGELKKLIELNGEVFYNKKRELQLYYFTSQAYFMAGDYRNALLWNNKVINNKGFQLSGFYYASMLNDLLIHYELKNHELLDYKIKSAYLFFKKNNAISPLEKLIFGQLKKVLLNPVADDDKTLKILTNLRHEFIGLEREELGKNFFDLFDYISWINSKLEKKTFPEIIRRKYEMPLGHA